jgi:DNA topoisomerase IA
MEKIKGGLSAGRVQSPVRLMEREEIFRTLMQ